jgi:hypothetical protein
MMDPKDTKDQDVMKSLQFTLELLNSNKPNDRGPKDRVYAIVKNDLEHAYFYFVGGLSALNEYERQQRAAENAKKKEG